MDPYSNFIPTMLPQILQIHESFYLALVQTSLLIVLGY